MPAKHTVSLTLGNREIALRGVEAAIRKGIGGKPWVLELREPSRSDEQNDGLHGLIDQILKQRPTHNGVTMDKALYKAIFMQALGEEMRFLPTLDGKGMFPLGLKTSALSKDRFSELMEIVLAWCAQEGLTVKHFQEFAPIGDGK